MTTFESSPLSRAVVGSGRSAALSRGTARISEGAASCPPYNVERKGADRYRVTDAVAGFSGTDLDVAVRDKTLIVRGEHRQPVGYLRRGIDGRSFEPRFMLVDFIGAAGANPANGLLRIGFVREVRGARKPWRIEVQVGDPRSSSGRKKAAEPFPLVAGAAAAPRA